MKAKKPTMNATIHRAIEQILGALKTHDEQRADYLRDPHPWQPERERHLAAFDAERERAIVAAAAAIDKESSSIQAEFRKTRKTAFDAVEVAEAWRRCQELLKAGLGLADVVALPGFSRETAEAIRLNARTHFTAALKGERAETVEASTREVLDLVDRAELPAITDRTEAYATERELERRAGLRAVDAIGRFAAERRAGIPADAAAMLSLGHALSAEGFEATPPADDPAAAAERERNSLDPKLRDALAANVAERPNGRTPRVMAAPIRRS